MKEVDSEIKVPTKTKQEKSFKELREHTDSLVRCVNL